MDGMVTAVSDVQSQELAAKISENAELHLMVRIPLTYIHVGSPLLHVYNQANSQMHTAGQYCYSRGTMVVY